VLMLLALIAASFMRTTRTEINITRNLIESAEAEALAVYPQAEGIDPRSLPRAALPPRVPQ